MRSIAIDSFAPASEPHTVPIVYGTKSVKVMSAVTSCFIVRNQMPLENTLAIRWNFILSLFLERDTIMKLTFWTNARISMRAKSIMEMWSSVKGSSGYYEVSNHGRVRSCDRATIDVRGYKHQYRSRILKPSLHKQTGYLRVKICAPEFNKVMYVHQLVAEVFVSGYSAGKEVNHIDGVKTNCRASNLEWITSLDNKLHAFRIGLVDYSLRNTCRGVRHPRHKLSELQVKEIRKRLDRGDRHTHIANDFGVSRRAIYGIAKGTLRVRG